MLCLWKEQLFGQRLFQQTKLYNPRPSQRNPQAQVNMLEDQNVNVEPSFRYSSLLVNFTYQNRDWWLDSRANVHVCFDRDFFKLFCRTSAWNWISGIKNDIG